MPLAPGDLIAQKYRLVRKLGEGAMGIVYEGLHERLKTSVALKFLHKHLAERPGLGARFLQEAQLAASIRNPHVATVWDVDLTADQIPFMVMELLHGETLRALLDRERRLSLPQTVDFSVQILIGLGALHELSIVHRDLKPDNVFATQERDGVVLKLIDFGIAKLRLPQADGDKLTAAGMILGTPEYMAPEQIVEAASVDQRADIYSVGALIYEMLSGQTVVKPTSLEATLLAVQTGQIRPIGELIPGLPKAFEAMVMRALSLNREQRFQTAAAFKETLVPFLASGPGATVRVSTQLIEAEIARASTFPAPQVAPSESERDRAHGSAGPNPNSNPNSPQYFPSPTASQPRRSNAPIVILGVVALLLGVAIGVIYFLQLPSKTDSTWPIVEPLATTPASESAVEVKPEFPTPTSTVSNPHATATNQRPPARAPTRPLPPNSGAPDAGAAASAPPPFSIPLPSGLPSGFPSAISIPTALPSEFPIPLPPWPGFPQPTPPNAAPPDAGSPAIPP